MRRSVLSMSCVCTAVALVASAAGCGSGSSPAPGPARPPVASTTPSPSGPPYHPVINPASFSNRVSNPLFPLAPGTTNVFAGSKDGKPEQVETTVTREAKTIMGVRCVVISDVVTSNQTLVEKTLDWYAQDAQGNVWYFGEDSKDYTNGVVTSTHGTWEAGVDNAQPGIVMPASPRVGQSYRQESRPGVAEDQAKVLQIDVSGRVPYGAFRSGLTTLDTDPLDPAKIEHKTFAPGIGLVSAVRQGSAHVEDIQLISVRRA